MEYKIFAALHEDIDCGFVWSTKKLKRQRATVRIYNKLTNKTVYCEALQIENNFLNRYNDEKYSRHKIELTTNPLVINEWYRMKLGIHKTQTIENLIIAEENHLIAKLFTNIEHPQIIVRFATWMGILSLSLGLLGFIIGIMSCYKSC